MPSSKDAIMVSSKAISEWPPDTAIINELTRSNLRLPECYMPDDEIFALREHLRARKALVNQRTMVKNRVHGVLHRRGILAPQAGLFSSAGQSFLEQAELDDAGRAIVQRYLALIENLDRIIKESMDTLKVLMRQPRWTKPAALLMTMPGIGQLTALTILAELGDIHRFRSRGAVANYAGLVPVVRDSDNKRFRGRITARGSAHLRAMLIEAAWMAVPRVPAYQQVFDRIACKRNKQTAIVAVARRILENAWTMLKKEEPFRYRASSVQAVALLA